MSILVDEEEPLVDVEDPPFEPRDVQVQNKNVEQEFDIYDFLGRGKFGEVKRCVERTTGKEFAAKFINAPRPQDKKEVEQEVEIMKKLQHKRLLQLYDCFCSKTEMCLVLEIILGGELFDRVIDEDFILTERACVVFMRQICEGVQYMHGKNIIHLDMKPENILCLTRTGNRIKIIDFGLAREYHPKKDLRVLFGTPEFMAPEVVQYDPISFSTDMWSVGVICYVLLSGLSPFMGDNDGDTLVNVIKGEYDFNYVEFHEVSDNAKDLINKLLVRDKSKRLSATQCLEHPWLRREKPRTTSSNLDLSKKRLKRFVYRRKWQKIVNAIIALKRMGVKLQDLRRRESVNSCIRPQESIFGWDAKNGTPSRNGLKPQTDKGLKEKSPETKRKEREKTPDTTGQQETSRRDVNGLTTNKENNVSTTSQASTERDMDNRDKNKRANSDKKPVQEETNGVCIETAKRTSKGKFEVDRQSEEPKREKNKTKEKSERHDSKESAPKREPIIPSGETNCGTVDMEEEKQEPPWLRKGKKEPGVLRHVPLKERGDVKSSRKKSQAPWQKRRIKKKDGIHLQTLKDWREALNDPESDGAKLQRKDLPTDEMIATIESSHGSAPDSPEVEGGKYPSAVTTTEHVSSSRTGSPVQAAPASMRVVKKSRQIEIDENGRPKSGVYDVNVTLTLGNIQKNQDSLKVEEATNVDTKGKPDLVKKDILKTGTAGETDRKGRADVVTDLEHKTDNDKRKQSDDVCTEATIIIGTTPLEKKKRTDENQRRGFRKNKGKTDAQTVLRTDQEMQKLQSDPGGGEFERNKKNKNFSEAISRENPVKQKACEGGKIKSKVLDKTKDESSYSKVWNGEKSDKRKGILQDTDRQVILQTGPKMNAKQNTGQDVTSKYLTDNQIDDSDTTSKVKRRKEPEIKKMPIESKQSNVVEKLIDRKGHEGSMSPSKTDNAGMGTQQTGHKPWTKSQANLAKFNALGVAAFQTPSKPVYPWQSRGLRKFSLPPEDSIQKKENRSFERHDKPSPEELPSTATVQRKFHWKVYNSKHPDDSVSSLPKIMSKELRKPQQDEPATIKTKGTIAPEPVTGSKPMHTDRSKTKSNGTKATNNDLADQFSAASQINQRRERDIGIYATLPKKTHRPKIVPKTISDEHKQTIPEYEVQNSNGSSISKAEGEEEGAQPQIKIPSIRERIKRLTSINETCEKVSTPKVNFIYDQSCEVTEM